MALFHLNTVLLFHRKDVLNQTKSTLKTIFSSKLVIDSVNV